MAHVRVRLPKLLALLTAVFAAACAPTLVGCDEETARDVGAITIDDRTFFLELALDQEERIQGLSGREQIEEDGGMLFVFPRPAVQEFVMRDCPVPIDIIFVDPTGRVTATHQMQVEPREEGESADAYNRRLKRYSSRFSAQFVIELKGGTLSDLSVSPGDRLDLDVERLKEMAK